MSEFDFYKDGIKHKAIVIMCFKVFEKEYCIFGVKNNNKNHDIYCGEIINNKVVPVQEEDKKFTTGITKKLIKF